MIKIMDENIIKIFIVRKLVRGNIWGAKHTPISFVISGIPKHFSRNNQGKKLIENALKELVSSEFVILSVKKTGSSSEQHMSLNPRKVEEINEFLENATYL
jgi:hypothetical protein